MNITHVEEEGPKRGFSLRGWNENLPRKGAKQEAGMERLGQSFSYMVITNKATLATTNVGTSHGNHRLNGMESRFAGKGLSGGTVGARAGPGWTVWWSPRRVWDFTSAPAEDGVDGSLPFILRLTKFDQRLELSNTWWSMNEMQLPSTPNKCPTTKTEYWD